jgi:hypothetical protein
MKLRHIILFILILPLTLVLDFILFAFTRVCPSCGSFWQFVQTEGALSFPMVVGFIQWFEQILIDKKIIQRKSI